MFCFWFQWLFSLIITVSLKNKFFFCFLLSFRTMWLCKWQSERWFWSRYTAFIIFNAKFNSTFTIIIHSSCWNCIISYWNSIWVACSHTSIMCSWSKFQWRETNWIHCTINIDMDDKRSWCMRFISTSIEIDSTNRISIETFRILKCVIITMNIKSKTMTKKIL